MRFSDQRGSGESPRFPAFPVLEPLSRLLTKCFLKRHISGGAPHLRSQTLDTAMLIPARGFPKELLRCVLFATVPAIRKGLVSSQGLKIPETPHPSVESPFSRIESPFYVAKLSALSSYVMIFHVMNKDTSRSALINSPFFVRFLKVVGILLQETRLIERLAEGRPLYPTLPFFKEPPRWMALDLLPVNE